MGVKVEAIDSSEPMLEESESEDRHMADAPDVSHKDGRTQTGVS